MNKDFVKYRKTLVLYTTAICNLNCNYCYIDKNPALKKIDELLDQSFTDKNYYINFAKEIFPDPNQLKDVEFWGGEPTLRLDRAYNITEQLINYYPNLYSFMFSTNFTSEIWFEQVGNFLKIFEKFPDRKFKLDLQLSLDGPKYINDMGRGIGTTEKFLNNYKELLKKIKSNNWIPKNILLNIFFKPTLSAKTFSLLQDKNSVIKYYQFFDKLSEMALFLVNNNFDFKVSIPNTAEPAPTTKHEGILFANFCRLCREIEKENQEKQYFHVYRQIIPYASGSQRFLQKSRECINMSHGCSTCGIGLHVIGLLPNRKVSLCHNGFVDLLQEYKEYCKDNINDNTIKEYELDSKFFDRKTIIRDTNCDVEDLLKWAEIVAEFAKKDSTFQLANITAQIMELARLNMIDQKYTDKMKAAQAARYISESTPYCMRNNLTMTGSIVTMPSGIFKLLLNGALDYIGDAYENLG